MLYISLSTSLITVAALSSSVPRLAAQQPTPTPDSVRAAPVPPPDTGVQGYAPNANAPTAPTAAERAVGPPAVAPPPPSLDAGMMLVPPRGTDRIKAGLELAKSDARDADADKAAALDRQSRAKAEVEV